MADNNALGHADGVPSDEYGINDTGVWSENTQIYDYTVPVVDAAPFSFEDFTGPVDQSTVKGDPGPGR